MITLKTIRHQQRSTTRDALSCVLFNLEKVIREVNARGTILFKSTQLLAYADDIDIMGRTTRDLQIAFIQIKQAAQDVGLDSNEGNTKYWVGEKEMYL